MGPRSMGTLSAVDNGWTIQNIHHATVSMTVPQLILNGPMISHYNRCLIFTFLEVQCLLVEWLTWPEKLLKSQ